MNYGKMIRILREHKNMSQRAFAVQIGISQTALSQLESGITKPSTNTLEKIAVLFDTSNALLILAAVDVRNDLGRDLAQCFIAFFPNFEKDILALIDDDLAK